MNTELIKDCIKLMFTSKWWWFFPCMFVLGFCAPSPFTDNYWIMILFGILSFPLAVIIMVTEVKIIRNKEEMIRTIRDYIETR